MNTDLCASPVMISVSPYATPHAPDAIESPFSKPGISPPTASVAQRQFMHHRTTRKNFPYPPRRSIFPASVEVDYSAHVMGRGYQPEFSLEATQKSEEQLERGLSQMSSPTVYKGYRARLAAREAACQRLLLTAWEIEEAERFATFIKAIHTENERWFGMVEEELQDFRRMFSQHGQEEVAGNKSYLQAVYEDKCEVLRIISVQADQVGQLLGKHVKENFLQSTGKSFRQPGAGIFCAGNGVHLEESDETSEGSDDLGSCRDGNLDDSDVATEELDD
ncbi:uncharacterized protein EDB91DRAFT_1256471 [Suillus paluster]|uniref:uncharacterized protein n=1 Tax=Suillus paluster TaxID=48578 RepID=UPI001B874CB6|nr:uncharacterized protein EDB91DRAFT_1256471 [Suillus paluster]KAG1721548.1 hypothetical protein EDB91DRAFT_1256471 [Suillus paluster]